jgi:hypothetical protein
MFRFMQRLRAVAVIDNGSITIIDGPIHRWKKYRWPLLCFLWGGDHAPCLLSTR